MPHIHENIAKWGPGGHDWSREGDEFEQFATLLGQDYDLWKKALIEEFLTPNISQDKTVLEIGCGYGRWSEHLLGAKKLYLTDLNENCTDRCKEKFGEDAATYINSSGPLPQVPDDSIDFVWCFDVMVHIEPQDIEVYVQEIKRVLKTGGTTLLHASGNNGAAGGWRSAMNAQIMKEFIEEAGLTVLDQTDSWGDELQYSVKLHGDIITTAQKTRSKEGE